MEQHTETMPRIVSQEELEAVTGGNNSTNTALIGAGAGVGGLALGTGVGYRLRTPVRTPESSSTTSVVAPTLRSEPASQRMDSLWEKLHRAREGVLYSHIACFASILPSYEIHL